MPREGVRLNWPNRITLARILLIPLFLIAVLRVKNASEEWAGLWRWTALSIFLAVAVGDALDGLLARRLNQTTEFGRLLDPAADKMLMISAYVILASRRWAGPPIPDWLTVLVVSRDVMIALGYTFSRLLGQAASFRVTWLGKVCTVCQMVTVLAVLWNGAVVGVTGLRALYWLTVAVTAVSGVDYMRQGRAVLVETRTPHSDGP